jgi:hypothetical protein
MLNASNGGNKVRGAKEKKESKREGIEMQAGKK